MHALILALALAAAAPFSSSTPSGPHAWQFCDAGPGDIKPCDDSVLGILPFGTGDFSYSYAYLFPDGGGVLVTEQFGSGGGLSPLPSIGIEFDGALLDGGSDQTIMFIDTQGARGIFVSGAFTVQNGNRIQDNGGEFLLASNDGLTPMALVYPDVGFCGTNDNPGFITELNGGVNKHRSGAVAGRSHQYYESENVRDCGGAFFHDADSTANDGVLTLYDGNNGAPATECATTYYVPAGVGDVTSIAVAVSTTCVNGVLSLKSAISPGQTVPTCASALEGAIVIKPRAGATPSKRCTCVNTAGSFAWASETLAAGAISLVTVGGSSTVCP